jgi:hypothetical protein
MANSPRIHDPLFGLKAWHGRVEYLFKPIHSFIACGTQSDPEFSPLGPEVAIVNAGIPVGESYDYRRRQYWMAAFTAASAYALNRNDWDLLVFLDTDVLVGAVDFKSLLNDFTGRPEEILSPAWAETIGGPILALKRSGVVRFMHKRIQSNCVLDGASPDMMFGEDEMKAIYSGTWWNPWPNHSSMRQDYSVNPNDPNPMGFLNHPLIRQPHPDVVDEYLKTQWSQVVPL